MIVFVLLGGVALIAIVGGIACAGSKFLSRSIEAVFRRFPRTREFAFGAMFGFYAGVVPAIVAYMLIHRPWAAGLVDGSFVLAGGLGWVRISGHSRQQKPLRQPLPNRPTVR